MANEKTALANMLSRITAAEVVLQCGTNAPEAGVTAVDTDLWLSVAAEGSLRGEMALRVPQLVAQTIVKPLLDKAPQRVESNDSVRDTLVEIVRKTAEDVSRAVGRNWGANVYQVSCDCAPSWPPAGIYWLETRAESSPRLTMEVQVSAALGASLARLALSRDSDRNLVPAPEILKDVELVVALRFGSKKMLLGEILELGPGSVIELDEQVEDPVELLLDDKAIARGDVVVVEGNLGIRVRELLSSASGPAPR
jgi:flagellar motor switch protein FliN